MHSCVCPSNWTLFFFHITSRSSAHGSNETPQELQKKETTLSEIPRQLKAETAQKDMPIDDQDTDNNEAKVDMPAIPPQPHKTEVAEFNEMPNSRRWSPFPTVVLNCCISHFANQNCQLSTCFFSDCDPKNFGFQMENQVFHPINFWWNRQDKKVKEHLHWGQLKKMTLCVNTLGSSSLRMTYVSVE